VFVDLDTAVTYQPRTLAYAAQMRDYVRSTPAAFGYVDLAYAGELHAIPYEGVPCTRATVRSGVYPARRPLGFVTRGRPRGEVRRFLRWIRHSRTAHRVIATRYVPVTTPGR
jgi:ABC-type phosphate transport system substrate-binding protein